MPTFDLKRRTAICLIAGGVLTMVGNRVQAAQAAATAVRVVIGFSKDSASDGLLGLMQPELATNLKRPVEVDLKPGELGASAARSVVGSAPDGHTLLVATFGTHAINPNLGKDLGYDPISDFSPVCLATRAPLILGTNPALGVKTPKELIALAAMRELTYGSSGVGSAPYLAALLFQRMTGARMVHRAYPDTRVLYEDLAANRLNLSFNNAASMMSAVERGQAHALATTAGRRSPALANIPTLAETGLADYQLDNWLGFVAPPHTPSPILNAQAEAIAATLRAPHISSELLKTGIEIVGGSPSEFADFISSELRRWSWLRGIL